MKLEKPGGPEVVERRSATPLGHPNPVGDWTDLHTLEDLAVGDLVCEVYGGVAGLGRHLGDGLLLYGLVDHPLHGRQPGAERVHQGRHRLEFERTGPEQERPGSRAQRGVLSAVARWEGKGHVR